MKRPIIYLGVFTLSLFLLGGAFLSGWIASYIYTHDQPPIESPKPIVLDPFKIYTLVNEYRVQNDLKPLNWNPEMCKFSAQRLLEVPSDWSHSGFNKMSTSSAKPYPYVYAGENLGRGFYDEQEQLDAWIKSPEHKENLDNKHYTDTCISTKELYAIQEFASF